jgi:hypothetical protein
MKALQNKGDFCHPSPGKRTPVVKVSGFCKNSGPPDQATAAVEQKFEAGLSAKPHGLGVHGNCHHEVRRKPLRIFSHGICMNLKTLYQSLIAILLKQINPMPFTQMLRYVHVFNSNRNDKYLIDWFFVSLDCALF